MSYCTRWIGRFSEAHSAGHFIWNSLKYHLLSLRPHHLYGARRTPATVREGYDQARQELLEKLAQISWEDYVFFPEGLEDFIVVDDCVRWGTYREARRRILEKLVGYVARHATPGRYVVEFGSGDGRNLLHLSRVFPQTKFIGLELSPLSVELARAAAQKFDVTGVQFHVSNVCERLPALPPEGEVVLAYSLFALEMMPRIHGNAVENMLSTTSGGLLFMEPAPELWLRDARGIAGRLRALQMDRLQGLPSKLRRLERGGKIRVQRMERSRLALNPLNELCELYALKGA